MRSLRDETRDELLAYPNVVGVGLGARERRGRKNRFPRRLATVVYVTKKLPLEALDPGDVIPPEVETPDGDLRETDVQESGIIRATGGVVDRLARVRPAPGGVSVGHGSITAGTLGAKVYDRESRFPLILSNNHVLANSNDADVGDPIYQPGPHDGGTTFDNVIGWLERFEPIAFVGAAECPVASRVARMGNALARLVRSRHRLKAEGPLEFNRMDAAVAGAYGSSLAPGILEVGAPDPLVAETYVGLSVRKSGRTTGLSEGVVESVDVSLQVQYGGGRVALFEGQAASGMWSQPGDSGSLVVTSAPLGEAKPVGLLFAGSDAVTVFSPIGPIMESLSFSFEEPV